MRGLARCRRSLLTAGVPRSISREPPPQGPLFRLLHDNGLKEQVAGCTTRDEMLDVLDLHLGLDLSTRALESDARPLDPDAIFTDADETPQAPRRRAGPITVD